LTPFFSQKTGFFSWLLVFACGILMTNFCGQGGKKRYAYKRMWLSCGRVKILTGQDRDEFQSSPVTAVLLR
jgi:hypothetical protein